MSKNATEVRRGNPAIHQGKPTPAPVYRYQTLVGKSGQLSARPAHGAERQFVELGALNL